MEENYLKVLTTKIFELRKMIEGNLNYEELDNQLKKELSILKEIDEEDEYFNEVERKFL